MDKKFHVFFSFLLLPLLVSCADQKQTYIVHFRDHNVGTKTIQEIQETHHSYLLSVKETEEDARSSLIYSYKHSINGFAASLTPHQASRLSAMDEVFSVSRSHPGKYEMHTTRSWRFSGVEKGSRWQGNGDENLLVKSRYRKNTVVGLVDNGIWPESKSFRDDDMDPVPRSWRGTCQSGDLFNSSHCNKKIIGARYYIKGYEAYYGPLNRSLDYRSPRDPDGHGTHTASTAAGQTVHHASALGGFAAGTASGGAPRAHLAIYKACWVIPGQGKETGNTCFEEDMLAAIDDAIADGVDVLSISIGTKDPTPYIEDGIAIGALHAIKHNIVVACSAGNYGPTPATLSNQAPWIITVGASSLDRTFLSPVALGNGKMVVGGTITPYKLKRAIYPLVLAEQVINPGVPNALSGQCLPGSLSPEKTKGKIVLCFRGYGKRVGKGIEVKRAGGVGFILANNEGEEVETDSHLIPATAVGYTNGRAIYDYINSTRFATAYIVPAKTVLRTKPAPSMPAFTSRGPNILSPDLLKPDITAPGLNILAAWSEASSPSKLDQDSRVVQYNIQTGTSMSCPHVAGASVLLKAIHPDWSSEAIRSALMTTAGLIDNQGNLITSALGGPADPFQFGSGHFRPTKAADPGLIYDATYEDYVLFLCSSGIKNFDSTFKCPENLPSPRDLNYPSLAIPNLNGTVTTFRTVTNVGSQKSAYFVSVKPPLGIAVKISPPILYFNRVGQKQRFTVTIKTNEAAVEKGKYVFGWYTWSDGIHNVRSPIAVSVA